LDLVESLLAKIESAGTAEKIAENDHLMKCTYSFLSCCFLPLTCLPHSGLMRVILTARQTLTPRYDHILARLVTILGVISKNPSNPRFDQFIFESISGLMR
jgi:exportin-2 (importin alpha re-exporter)